MTSQATVISSRRIRLSTAFASMSCAILAEDVAAKFRFPRLGGRRHRSRLLALVAFRDEMRFLPGLYENLATQVDGVIALDDGSTDGSGDYAAAQPLTVQLISIPNGVQAELEDGLNQRSLIQAAHGHGADWLLGIDADERVERRFRERAEREFARADDAGVSAFWSVARALGHAAPVAGRRDLGPEAKGLPVRSDPAHAFHTQRVHSVWAGAGDAGRWLHADLRLYHLRMIDPADRMPRVERYRRIDPDRTLQEIGYEYMLDDSGLELCPIEPGREYEPVGR